jgi:CheY-like chemotaxis protein
MIFPDVVLADVVMPGMDGVETAKAIMKLVPGCRIILFSGNALTSEILANARAQGYHFEVLAKPVNPEEILEKLTSAPGNAFGSVAV